MKKVIIVAAKANMIRQFNQRNINMLISKGYEVHVATNFIEFGSMSESENQALQLWLTNIGAVMHQIDFSRGIGNFKQNILALKQLKKVFVQNKFEFIHVHSPLGGILGRLVARRYRVPSIYTVHGFHFFKGGPLINWLIFFPLEFLFAYFTDWVVTINQSDENIARSMPYKHRSRIHGNGTDILNNLAVSEITKEKIRKRIRMELSIPNEAFVVLSVGELNANKNHRVVLEAISRLKDTDVEIYYLIAGVGPLKEELLNSAKELGISEHFRLLGYRTDVHAINYAADLFVFPSLREGLGIAGLDAVSDGTYILGSQAGGIRDYVFDDSFGKLFDPTDAEKLSSLIKERIGMETSRYRDNSKLTSFDNSEVDKIISNIYEEISNSTE